jgi:hypothetical protein
MPRRTGALSPKFRPRRKKFRSRFDHLRLRNEGIHQGWTWPRESDEDQPAATTTPAVADFKFEKRPAQKQRSLAPGVDVYRPLGAGLGLVPLTDHGVLIGTFRFQRELSTQMLPTPRLKRVRKLIDQGVSHVSSYIVVEAELDTVAPPNVVGAVLYRIRGTKVTALSFQRVWPDGTNRIYVYTDAGRCAVNPGGMQAPSIGDEVSIAWVDAVGRISGSSGFQVG